MIDLAVGAGVAATPHWAAPELRLAASWRPHERVELHVAASQAVTRWGTLTDEGVAATPWSWTGPVLRYVRMGEVTVGAFPLAVEHDGWTAAVGARLGVAVVERERARYEHQYSDDVLEVTHEGSPLPAATAWAVGELSHGRAGVRLRLGSVAWAESDDGGYVVQVLMPGVEGFFRW